MSEMFQRSAGSEPIAPLSAGSAYLDAAGLAWQPAGVAGFWIKPLFEDPACGDRTWLMKIDPGAFAPMHAHAEQEQIYVLQGAFYDQNRTVEAGGFVCRAPGEPHTAGSREGALVLLIYSPARR